MAKQEEELIMKKGPRVKKSNNCEYLEVLMAARDKLRYHLPREKNTTALELLIHASTAIHEERFGFAYTKIAELLAILTERAKENETPMLAPPTKAFADFIGGEILDDDVEFMVILHSVFYLSMIYYEKK